MWAKHEADAFVSREWRGEVMQPKVACRRGVLRQIRDEVACSHLGAEVAGRAVAEGRPLDLQDGSSRIPCNPNGAVRGVGVYDKHVDIAVVPLTGDGTEHLCEVSL